MIDADALIIHLNPLQEAIQPEGETQFKGIFNKISEIVSKIDMPLIIKETGAGISKEIAEKLSKIRVEYIDVAGAGGTSWVLVDSIRSGKDSSRFRNWGIPTAASILEARTTHVPLIATGGIRNGLQMAKAVLLGADVCGIALPFLRILSKEGTEGVERYIDNLKQEFCFSLYLTGSANIGEFRNKNFVLTGRLREWAEQRCAYSPRGS